MNKSKAPVQIIEMESGTLIGEFANPSSAERSFKKGLPGIRKGYNYAIISFHKSLTVGSIKVEFDETTNEYLNRERADLAKDQEEVGIPAGGHDIEVVSLDKPVEVLEPVKELTIEAIVDETEESEELEETVVTEVTTAPLEAAPVTPPVTSVPEEVTAEPEPAKQEHVEEAYQNDEGPTFTPPNPAHSAAPGNVSF